MISFSVKATRNPAARAWDVSVDAFLIPSEHFHRDLLEATRPIGPDDDGLRIARLSCLMIHSWGMHEADDLIETLDDHDGMSGTFDLQDDAMETASNFIDWAHDGGADALFAKDPNPIQTLVFGRVLTSDAGVDRGAMLAFMVQHLAAFCSGRYVFVHQDHHDHDVVEGWSFGVDEHVRTFLAVSDRLGIDVRHVAHGLAMAGDAFGAAFASGGPLPTDAPPLLVASIPDDGPRQPEWVIADMDEIEVVELMGWAKARLGVDLVPDAH
jgi:hypothetical protein